jgi:hypothetical protein
MDSFTSLKRHIFLTQVEQRTASSLVCNQILISRISSSDKGSLNNPFTNQSPLLLIFSFGENKPSQLEEGLHSSHREIVEIIFDSSSSLFSLSSTSITTKLKFAWIY